FERHGLIAPSLWSAIPIPGDESRLDGGAAALCDALTELGGLYAAFARFLGWRADLLGGYYITRLRGVRFRNPSVPRSDVAALIRAEFGAKAEDVARNLSAAPAWNTLWRTAYLSRIGPQRVIFEVPHDPMSEERFHEFEK